MRSEDELHRFFKSLDIDCSSIEFYNTPTFLKAEEKDPLLLAAYGEYVEARKYSPEYLERSRLIVPQVISYLRQELRKDGRLGACHDAAFAIMKILERLGIWCHISAGSLTVDFDAEIGRSPQYWAHVFEKPGGVGHAWVVAPPFRVIDLTISQQQNIGAFKAHLPDYVIVEEVGPVAGVALGDILDRDLEAKMRLAGHRVPTIHELMSNMPDIAKNLTTFRPFSVRHGHVTLKYFPCRPSALIERFEIAKTQCFSRRTMVELFHDVVTSLERSGVQMG